MYSLVSFNICAYQPRKFPHAPPTHSLNPPPPQATTVLIIFTTDYLGLELHINGFYFVSSFSQHNSLRFILSSACIISTTFLLLGGVLLYENPCPVEHKHFCFS